MRFVGMMLVIVAGIGIGRFYSRRLYRRVEWLRQAETLLLRLEQQIHFTAKPLTHLWRELADDPAFARFSLLQDTAAACAEHPFREALDSALQRAADEGTVGASEHRVLAEFAADCGKSGVAQQMMLTHACREQMEQIRRQAQDDAAAHAKLYQTVGAAGGIALALFLI